VAKKQKKTQAVSRKGARKRVRTVGSRRGKRRGRSKIPADTEFGFPEEAETEEFELTATTKGWTPRRRE